MANINLHVSSWGYVKSLIGGTKALTEIVVTFINEVLWNLSTKSYSEQVLKQIFSIISLKKC